MRSSVTKWRSVAELALAFLVFSISADTLHLHAVRADAGYDVVILNGRVMDPESNLDAIRNVGVRAGKIAVISSKALTGRETIDARGLVVAPGFIDLHQHGQNAENYAIKAADGVTTALELEVGVADVDSWYAARQGKALINYGASAGHIPVRMAVMHDPGQLLPSGDAAHRAATPEEIEQIKAMLKRGLDRGALAVGLGPAYTAGASNWEILQVFEVAARYHASCHVHIRSTLPVADGDVSGLEEVLACAAVTGAPLHVVHIQSTSGPNTVRELEMIEEARRRGMDVTTECYPYSMGMTEIRSALFDHKDNEPESYYAGLLRPETGEHLTRELFLKYRKEGGMIILPSNTEANVDAAVASPLTMIASDGAIFDGKGHPRTAGTYARVLGEYVREKKSVTLMEAIRKMSLMPAQRLEDRAPVMKNKGRIRTGADADITIVDPERVKDMATYQQPVLHSVGIEYVLVNGVTVVKSEVVQQGVAPGQGLRAPVR
jgi:N-acyl-D-aspartate/D-glutamate deacylase